MYACTGLERAVGDLNAAYAGGLSKARIDADDKWIVIQRIDRGERLLEVNGMHRLVQRAKQVKPWTFIPGQCSAYQRTEAVARGPVGTDTYNDNLLIFPGLREMKQKTMNNSGMDFRVGMWYF